MFCIVKDLLKIWQIFKVFHNPYKHITGTHKKKVTAKDMLKTLRLKIQSQKLETRKWGVNIISTIAKYTEQIINTYNITIKRTSQN